MIELPEWPAPNGATAYLVDFGGFLVPLLGGRVQRLDRMGNRHRLSVSLPPLGSEKDGRIFVQRLKRGKTEGVRMEYPLLSFRPGLCGQPVVNGADQGGRLLKLRNLTPNYGIREGQPFALVQPEGRYVYSVDLAAVADAAGTATVQITPMLRAPTIDGGVAEFTRPMIEGFIKGDEIGWEMSLAHDIGLSFEIEEYA
ncbi:hypothetical protein E5673_12785 [Sphingomonas sp. PAMC26645]|uniref:hypothetical protein n=1 Tax=Sphingomonas sp. PAMC26645 TaxID=2565555 RepID=UPI00109DF21F|nr:hypothetical protein [Sphingomonas sp. PAMC26645]QCB42984.1 hypothetical protein E5673_12785 [Sphingomonas sp. PAMC26645]